MKAEIIIRDNRVDVWVYQDGPFKSQVSNLLRYALDREIAYEFRPGGESVYKTHFLIAEVDHLSATLKKIVGVLAEHGIPLKLVT